MSGLFKKMRGDEILRIEKSGSDIDVSTLLKEVRSQGAMDSDIRDWWNMPDSQHEEIIQENDSARTAAFKCFLDEGYSKDDAIKKLRKSFPIYDKYQPGDIYTSADSNLPYELLPRINRFFCNEEVLKKYNDDISSASSLNAFIRRLIKRRVI